MTTYNEFLKAFNYELTTIQVFPDTKIEGKAVWNKKKGKILSNGAEGSTAISFDGAITSNILADLKILQPQRMGVFFMVNEGDGELHGHTLPRNQQAVRILKALFVDTDEGDRKTLDKFLKRINIKPHFVVESSPTKYHYYFLIEDTEATKQNRFKWLSCQTKFASLDSGFDSSMADVSRVLRIPGFYHTKNKPFKVRIKYASTHQRYDLNDLYDKMDAKTSPPRKGQSFDRPTGKLDAGRRHESLSAYLGSLSNTTNDPEVLRDAAIGYAQRHFKDSHGWLPGGDRAEELEDQINYVLKEREKEEVNETLEILDQVETENFAKLPDQFYFDAPGIVGKMVREICKHSVQPYPSFAFAAAASLVGTLKAPFIRSAYRNNPPSLYFLCLADSGRGKDFPRAALARVFIRLGFKSLFTQAFRSGPGWLRKLEKSQGIQLVLHDEAHHMFGQIRRSENDYITTLKPHLLRLFSSANEPVYEVGSVVTDNLKIGDIAYPTVNYCGFGVPTGFEDTFQQGELSEGLLTRFLVLRDHQPVMPMSEKDAVIPKRFEFEEDLRTLAQKLRLMLETAIIADDNPQEIKPRKFVTVPFEPQALQELIRYSKFVAKSRNKTKNKGIDILQSRLVEQVNRLAVMLSSEIITLKTVKWCIKFVDHCYKNMAVHVEGFNKGQANKDVDDLVKFVAQRIKKTNKPMVHGDFRFFRIRRSNELQQTIDLAINLNLLHKKDHYRDEKAKHGRKGTAYILGTID